MLLDLYDHRLGEELRVCTMGAITPFQIAVDIALLSWSIICLSNQGRACITQVVVAPLISSTTYQ